MYLNTNTFKKKRQHKVQTQECEPECLVCSNIWWYVYVGMLANDWCEFKYILVMNGYGDARFYLSRLITEGI